MIARLFKIMFWSALIFALIMANIPQPPVVGEVNDKSLHMLAFAVLAALVAPAYPSKPLWALFWGLAVFGAVIEFTQMFAGHGRQASYEDWVADIVAAGGVLLAIGLMRVAFTLGTDVREPSASAQPDGSDAISNHELRPDD